MVQKMLKLKIYANEILQMPETVCEGANTMELIDPYLLQSPVVGHYKIIFGRCRRACRYLNIPLWGVQKGKALQSTAYLAMQLVQNGFAEWVEFNEDEFDPAKAAVAIRMENSKNSHLKPLSEQSLKQKSESMKRAWARRHAMLVEMSEEERQKLKQERLEKRLAKKQAKAIAEGRVPADAAEVPDWFKFAKN